MTGAEELGEQVCPKAPKEKIKKNAASVPMRTPAALPFRIMCAIEPYLIRSATNVKDARLRRIHRLPCIFHYDLPRTGLLRDRVFRHVMQVAVGHQIL